MKIVGISSGSKNGNTEMLIKAALMEAEGLGASVELIRLHDLSIKYCRGCNNCMIDSIKGGDGQCVIKDDDAQWVFDKILESDAFIVGAPVYSLRSPGLLCAFFDRSLGNGRVFKREMALHPKLSATICVAGGEKSWNLAFALTTPEIMPELNNKLVDQMMVLNIVRKGQVLLHPDIMERARKMGRHLVESLKVPFAEAQYAGEQEGVCPLCHQDLLRVLDGGRLVECPICGVKGTVSVKEGRLSFDFDQSELTHKIRNATPDFRDLHTKGVAHRQQEYVDNLQKVREMVKEYAVLKPTLPPGRSGITEEDD